VFPMERKLSH